MALPVPARTASIHYWQGRREPRGNRDWYIQRRRLRYGSRRVYNHSRRRRHRLRNDRRRLRCILRIGMRHSGGQCHKASDEQCYGSTHVDDIPNGRGKNEKGGQEGSVTAQCSSGRLFLIVLTAEMKASSRWLWASDYSHPKHLLRGSCLVPSVHLPKSIARPHMKTRAIPATRIARNRYKIV